MIFYLVNVNYERETGEDNPGKVKESYLVPAVSCTDAERIVSEYIKPYVFGECETPQIKRVQFFDVFKYQEPGDDIWYKAKVEMIIIDGEKEIHKPVNVLVASNNLRNAVERLGYELKSFDYEIMNIRKTAIVEILEKEA